MWASYAIGYLFATFAGSAWPVALPIWKRYGRDEAPAKKDRHDPFIGQLMGLVERPLYVAAFLADAPTFVGIWLGLKVAGGWKGWQDEVPLKDGNAIPGRTVFNVMLIGSAVSVAYGWVGAHVIRALQNRTIESALVVPLTLMAAHFLLNDWLTSKVSEGRP